MMDDKQIKKMSDTGRDPKDLTNDELLNECHDAKDMTDDKQVKKMSDTSSDPKDLTDDELLDEFHKAKEAHKNADPEKKDDAYKKMLELEQKMIGRFELGAHMKKYRERYPG